MYSYLSDDQRARKHDMKSLAAYLVRVQRIETKDVGFLQSYL